MDLIHNTTRKHFTKYQKLAENFSIGTQIEINRLKGREETFMGKPKGYWLEKFHADPHLNNHPLSDFDSRFGFYGGMTKAETVCSLKHTIIFILLEAEPVFKDK